jgi:lysozyme
MTPAGLTRLQTEEGFRSHVYTDTTGHRTIGYGTNLEAGITMAQASAMLQCQLDANRQRLNLFDWFRALDSTRQDVVEDMVYNLGYDGFMQFHLAIAAIANGDYETAADEMLQSLWAKQLPKRAGALSDAMRVGSSVT